MEDVASRQKTTNKPAQEGVREWFNHTYQQRGLNYLRPMEAYYVFLEILKAPKRGKLLDIACGPGLLLRAAEAYGMDLTGIDISEVAIGMAKEALPQADLKVGNAESLPFPNNTFEYITCIGSLERMLELSKVLAEIKRVAREDAEICVMVRNSSRFSWKFIKEFLGVINKKGHQGAKSLKAWQQVFQEAGFQIKAIYPDKWPSVRWLRWLSLGGRLFPVNYKRVPVARANAQAYEFIFHLGKA